VTGFDVLNANNNTIAEGLVAATEVLVVDILNTTFPRGEIKRTVSGGHKIFQAGHTSYASMYAGADLSSGSTSDKLDLTDIFVDNELKMAKKHSSDPDTEVSDGAGTQVYLEMKSSTETNEKVSEANGGQNNRKNKKKKKRAQARQRSNINGRRLASLPKVSVNSAPLTSTTFHRSLVYYTPDYPINITNVDDVFDQSCPPGINCMKVFSTVQVVLEEGDDAEAIAVAITKGVADAFNDGSFFQVRSPSIRGTFSNLEGYWHLAPTFLH
jgi:hypothetical protein